MNFPRRLMIRASGIALTFLCLSLFPSARLAVERPVSATAPPESALWLAPVAATSAKGPLASAVDEFNDGKAAVALPALTRLTRDPELGGYALLYVGHTQLALARASEAAATARQLLAMQPAGYLGEAALWLSAEAAEAANDWPAAARALHLLSESQPIDPAEVYLRLGKAAIKSNDREAAIAALTKVHYNFPLSIEATDAGVELARLAAPATRPNRDTFPLDFDRAEALYNGKRYADARALLTVLRPLAAPDERRRLDLRLGATEYALKHYAVARDVLRPLIDAASPQQFEAEFYYYAALAQLGRDAEYVAWTRAFVSSHPGDRWAEEALNNLGTRYILADDDDSAAAVLAELYQRFPTGAHADRAAWRSGWWAYKHGNYREAIRTFESAATTFPHDDFRPPWLYWAARSHLRLGERNAAFDGYRRVVIDYRNSYYGRLAARAADQIRAAARGSLPPVLPIEPGLPSTIVPGTAPPNAAMIRRLLIAGLYDDAMLEVKKAQVEGGTSPMLEATIAYALNRKGELRPAITAMRRAYPQFMAAGGEALPEDLRRIIFPVAYWDLISRQAAAHDLDPFLMVALVAQESTFQADVRSVANAWGLMQIEPSTGRQYAAKLKIRPYSTAKLTQPELNVRIGMTSFADRVKKFGAIAPALAGYNAGDSRVFHWLADRPSFEQDEFIDDIPFPETQNYVKRILGTTEDYRALYGHLRPAK